VLSHVLPGAGPEWSHWAAPPGPRAPRRVPADGRGEGPVLVTGFMLLCLGWPYGFRMSPPKAPFFAVRSVRFTPLDTMLLRKEPSTGLHPGASELSKMAVSQEVHRIRPCRASPWAPSPECPWPSPRRPTPRAHPCAAPVAILAARAKDIWGPGGRGAAREEALRGGEDQCAPPRLFNSAQDSPAVLPPQGRGSRALCPCHHLYHSSGPVPAAIDAPVPPTMNTPAPAAMDAMEELSLRLGPPSIS